jgi:hypothetical protein
MTEWHEAGQRGHGDWWRPGYTKLPPNTPISPRQLQAGVRKLAKPEGICLDCDRRTQRRSDLGPAPKRCPPCTKDRKALRDRLRKRGLLQDNKPRRKSALPREARPPCCTDSGKITCPQHQAQRQSDYDALREADRRKQVDKLFAILDV